MSDGPRFGGVASALARTDELLDLAVLRVAAVDQLPDAQSRLSYIARLTGEAAEKVLNHVDGAKSEQEAIAIAHYLEGLK